ncbi:MAG: peptide chain release factor N(5)-glutamine methyltransferase, partial [bacterium]
MTLSALLTSARRDLRSFGVVNPDVEAETIISHVLGLKRSRIYIEGGRDLTPDQESRIAALVGERRRRCPLQYLLGEVEFMGLPLKMRQGVFIPRPETEILVETVIGRLGRGSGAVVGPKPFAQSTDIRYGPSAFPRRRSERRG